MLEDLDFADDTSLLSSKFIDLHEKTGRLAEESARVGLKLNMRNGKTLRTECASSREKIVWWMAKNWMTLRSLHTWELL